MACDSDRPNTAAARRLHLVAAFRQRAPPALICTLARQLGSGLMHPASQKALLDLLLPPVPLLPPDVEHARRVLRAAVLAAEADGEEASEELMQLYSACLMGQTLPIGNGSSSLPESLLPPPPQPGWCYKLWSYGPSDEPAAATLQHLAALEQRVAELRQRHLAQQQQQQKQPPFTADEGLPAAAAAGDARRGLLALHVSLNLLEGSTGCHEWEAGFFLSEWLLNHPHLVAGRCCLEVGCGAGMVGVALHRCGASHVLCTDGSAQTVANCRRNLQLNGVPLQIAQCCQLCWEDGWGAASEAASASRRQQQQQPAVVLGADLLYDPTVISVLLALLKQVLAAATPATGAAEPAEETAAPATGQPAVKAAAEPVAAAGPSSRTPLQQSEQQPSVYLATTLRNEATLQQFLAAAEADPSICIQQLEGPGAAAAAEPAGSGGAGKPTVTAAGAIRFHHLQELEAARSRIFLHRITLQAC